MRRAATCGMRSTGPAITTPTRCSARSRKHVDFAALNHSETDFVVTAVDVETGELKRFRNHPRKDEKKVEITPRHVLASGSLPPQFPATPIDDTSYWDGGIVDNTPLGDAIAAFSGDGEAERFLVVMNLFRKERPLPKNLIEVNDRLAELRYGNRLRQDSDTPRRVNELVRTVDRLAALVTEAARRSSCRRKSIARGSSRCWKRSPTSISPIRR